MPRKGRALELKIDRLHKAFGKADEAFDNARKKRNKAWLAYRNAMRERVK